MRKTAALLAAAVLSCKSAPQAKAPETAGASAGPSTPANPPATQVTGAQPAVPNVAGQPGTPPEAQHGRSASARAPAAPPPGIDLSAMDRKVNPCDD
ncbi:MAG TPA: hypothetical protein VFP52_07100, partial [Myxococcales bacterium]|nr:hypothetical protein [Myxococcales bacterium]